jgi:hypothetical protein
MNMKFELPMEATQQLARVWNDHILDTMLWVKTNETGMYLPFPIAVFAMANDINLGYYLAVKSGMNHRIPHRLWAERVCGAKSLSVINSSTTPGNESTSSFVSEGELSRDYEPYWLGEAPSAVFTNSSLPATPLFVYPENSLVPKMEREFVQKLCDRKDIASAVIITKSSVMLSDFYGPCICVM